MNLDSTDIPRAGRFFRFQKLLLNEGWLSPAYVGVDDNGCIIYLNAAPPAHAVSIEAVEGVVLPGLYNSHSHAFQYAMAGLAETHYGTLHDDFWSWREAMYHCALSVDPDQAEAIATMLYAEMLRQGYTSVVEFHYLHHDKNGRPYNHIAEMGERMISAAATAGIHITLVPVFYQQGNFGIEPQSRQRRFISESTDDYLELLSASQKVVAKASHARMGYGVHSLRAVKPEDVKRTFHEGPRDIPFHLHAAEQLKEVEDCMNFSGKRPVQWLLENMPMNDQFHLVHATHLDDAEVKGLARSAAHVVLCPSTEGNLGDGIFRIKEYVDEGGHWSIGTDSHIGLNPLEELRMMDYRQRLLSHQRNTFEGEAARYLILESVLTGRKAAGERPGKLFEIGKPLNAWVIDARSPLLSTTKPENLLSAVVYCGDTGMTLGTLVNGKWKVKHGRHVAAEDIAKKFQTAIRTLGMR